MKKLQVCIAGGGHIAKKAHIPNFKANPHTEVVAVCNSDLIKAQQIASEFGIPGAYDDFNRMLLECKPDIVSVCTPNYLHHEYTLKAVRAGAHVFCEKPPALNAAQAKEMEKAAAAEGKVLAYNFQLRHAAEVAAIKQHLDEGVLGNIYHVKATFLRQRGVPVRGKFLNKDAQGGGALIDIGVHVLDLALYMIGYPEVMAVLADIYSQVGKQGGTGYYGLWKGEDFTVEDSCFAHIRLKSDCSITLETAFAINMPQDSILNIQLFGDRGGASVFPPELYLPEAVGMKTNALEIPSVDQHKLSIDAFVDACLGKSHNLCNAQQGAQLQQLLDDLYASAQV